MLNWDALFYISDILGMIVNEAPEKVFLHKLF